MTNPRVRLARAILATAAAITVVTHFRIEGSLIDDALITFRYAAMLATGEGLVYNPGEAVLGTTTPAWAVILSVLGRIFRPEGIPTGARHLNAALLVACGLVAARLVRGMAERWEGDAGRAPHGVPDAAAGSGRTAVAPVVGAVAGALVMMAPFSVISSVAGMESPLFQLVVLTALLGLAEERWLLAAAAAGFAPLVRPEGALIVAVVGVAWLLGRARRGLAVPAALLAPGALMLLSIRLYYGSVVPHSVRAKQAGVYPIGVGESAELTAEAIRGALTGAPDVDVVTGFFSLGLLAGTLWLLRRSLRLWPAAALLWGYLIFYATSRTLIMPHYMALVEPFALLAWGAVIVAVAEAGLKIAGRRLSDRGHETGSDAVWRGRLAVGVGILLFFQPLRLYPTASVLAGEPSLEDTVMTPLTLRMAFYRVAAETVGPVIPPGTTVLMSEIGELGFRMPHVRVLDGVGLVSPEAIPFLPLPPEERVNDHVGAIPIGLVRAELPDLVMTLELFGARSLYDDAWFAGNYETVWQWANPNLVWGPLRIHARRGLPTGAALREIEGGVEVSGTGRPAA